MTEPDRSRLSRTQLEAMMLDAGVELLQEDGLGGLTAPLGYADAFRWLAANRGISVSRAQIHRRVWDSVDAYRADVMQAIVTDSQGNSYEATVKSFGEMMANIDVDGTSDGQRRELVTDLARRLTETNAEYIRNSREIAAFDAVFILNSLGMGWNDGTTAVHEALVQTYYEIMEKFNDIYRVAADAFSVAPGADWGLSFDDGIRIFSELVSGVNHGASGRSAFEPSLQKIDLGEYVWSVEGLVATAIAEHVASMKKPRAQQDEECVAEPRLVTHSNNDAERSNTESPVQAKRRMDRETLRRHMIEAGTAVLVENGFGHGAETITYARVFERIKGQTDIKVARAQVHGRIWQSQNEFQEDVVAAATKPRDAQFVQETAEAIVASLTDVDLTTQSGIRRAVARVCRVGTGVYLADVISSEAWMLGKAVMSFHALNRSRSDVVAAALHDAYEADISGWAELFTSMAEQLNCVPRAWTQRSLPEVSRIAAQCADVLAEGIAARTRMSDELVLVHAQVVGESVEEWNLHGLGLWSVIDFLMEPDPSLPE